MAMHSKDLSINLINGVDPDVLKGFLILIKEKYAMVDMANFFLEIKTGVSGINIAMANERDFLSHLCTVLSDQELTPDKQKDQLSAAEEHLRRAVIESYQKAVEIKFSSVLDNYEKYRYEVVPLQKRYEPLADAPDFNSIRTKIKEINVLRMESRNAKRRNKWDDSWEQGVATYVKAFLDLEKLDDTLEDYILIARQCHNDNKKREIIYISIGIVSIVINILFAFGLFK
jgi:hypothetical protein